MHLKIKAAIDDKVFYKLLQTMETSNLKADQADFINCPNITAVGKKVLSAILKPKDRFLDVSDKEVGYSGAWVVATMANVNVVTIDSRDLEHFWAQQGNIKTVQVRGKITDAELYEILLQKLYLFPTRLKEVDFTNCPNITPGLKILEICGDIDKALNQDDLDAQHRLGIFCFGLKDYKECKGWYQKAIEQGDTVAEGMMKILDPGKEVFDDQERKVISLRMKLAILAARGYEKIYQRFLNGVLIYRPNKGSDDGRIDLPIAALWNPLEGTFDLSQCGDAGKYLSISTGYKKGKKDENKNKVEIWLTPRFLVEKEINGSTRHFEDIFPAKWPETVQMGMFWTGGEWDDLTAYDYLTTQDFDELSNNNLYKKWGVRVGHLHGHNALLWWGVQMFSYSFSEARQG